MLENELRARVLRLDGAMGTQIQQFGLQPGEAPAKPARWPMPPRAGCGWPAAWALIEGGVDFLLLETSFDALNTKAVLYGIQEVHPGFPVMVSVSVSDRSGRTLTGQTIEAFFRLNAKNRLFCIFSGQESSKPKDEVSARAAHITYAPKTCRRMLPMC